MARVYDCLLGGKDNFGVDRDAAAQILAVFPEAPVLAKANREFAARAAGWCARAGIEQFLDIGTGLPTSPSVFEVAREQRPGARIVGVDNDPVVLCHDRALLEGTQQEVRIIAGDVRDPDAIFDAADELIYPDRPTAVFLAALLHLLTDAEDPARIVERIVEWLAPGSVVVISHVTSTGTEPDVVERIEEIYRGASSPVVFRSEAQIAGLFEGLELVGPGLVDVQAWPERGAVFKPLPARILAGAGRVPGGGSR